MFNDAMIVEGKKGSQKNPESNNKKKFLDAVVHLLTKVALSYVWAMHPSPNPMWLHLCVVLPNPTGIDHLNKSLDLASPLRFTSHDLI